MKHLLIFSGNYVECERWIRKNREELEAKGIVPHFLDPRGTKHLGFKDCFYTEVGTYYRTARYEEIYRYFESHNIIKI